MSEIVKNILVDNKIFIVRGMQVMIDSDLAKLYNVETKNLNKAVARNIERFPNDFMFQLTDNELENLRFQIGTTNLTMRRTNPYLFTEHGILMLSSVLRSNIASEINIQIMRTFTKLKNQSVPYFDIIKRLESVEIDNKETKKLLDNVVKIVINMQDIQDEAKENTRLIGFGRDEIKSNS